MDKNKGGTLMKDETIYKALRHSFNRGELSGDDLKEYIAWNEAKNKKQDFSLNVVECVNGDNAIANMINGYKVRNV